MGSRFKLVATVAAMVVAVGACTVAEGTTKSGDAAPTVLRLGTPDPRGRSMGDEIELFATSVSQQSGNAVRVEVVWEAANDVQGSNDGGWDQAVIRMLKDGKLDLALVPARAWDDVGEGAFRVLQAPFLIQSSAAATAVARSAMAKDMLAELSTDGLVGLALIPESLRHIATLREPLTTPGELRGVPTRAPLSGSVWETLRAIGLVPKDLNGDALTAAVLGGSIRAMETDFATSSSLPGRLVFMANVTPYAKFQVLAARKASIEKLSPEQQTVLRTLADRTVDDAVAKTDDTAAAAAHCTKGGTIVLAPRSTLSTFARATAPIIKRLEANPATGSQLTAIRSIIAATQAGAPVNACAPGPPKTPTARKTDVTKSPPFPQGVYRRETTAEYLMTHGVDESTARKHAGIWTLTFKDGQFNPEDNCTGTYAVEGDRVSVRLDGNHPDCGTVGRGELFSARWRLHGDQLLFADVLSGADGPTFQDFSDAMWGTEPFKKIG